MAKFCEHCGKPLQFENAEICPSCGVRIQSPPNIKNEKNPILAGLLSFLFSGLGQVYNGDFARGVLFLVGTIIGLCIFIIPGVIIWLYGVYDAYSIAKKMNAGEIPFKETNVVYMILFVFGLLILVAITIIFAAVLAAFVFGMAGTVQSTKTVGVIMNQNAAGYGVATIAGGPDVNTLNQINVVIDGGTEAVLIPKGSIAVGKSATTAKTVAGKRVVLIGYFNDGSQQILMDKQF